MTTAQKDKRLGELILYIASRCERAQYFGKTKLNKILFYADFLYYKKTGDSITGQEYMRLDQGPAPRRLVPVVETLRGERFAFRKEHLFGRVQERPLAIDEPDLTLFSGDQIAMVNEVIEAFWDQTGKAVSDLSHNLPCWQLAANGESIPYPTIFLSDRPLSEAEIEHGRRLTVELGL
jgi:hypothetical protein